MADICQYCGQVVVDGPVDHSVWSALGAVVIALLLADMMREAARRG